MSSTSAIDYTRTWKHPAVWKTHMVKTNRAWPDGVAVCIASCECGWIVTCKVSAGAAVALDDAITDHWLGVIADAESVPA